MHFGSDEQFSSSLLKIQGFWLRTLTCIMREIMGDAVSIVVGSPLTLQHLKARTRSVILSCSMASAQNFLINQSHTVAGHVWLALQRASMLALIWEYVNRWIVVGA